MPRRFGPLLILTAALMLPACEAVMMGVATPGLIAQKRVNLTNASYAAVETLIQRAGKRLKQETPLLVSDPVESTAGNMQGRKSPNVAPALAVPMRERFFQLGYNVIDESPADDGYNHVTGVYQLQDGQLTVVLYLRDRPAGRLLSEYRYTVPATYDVRRYMSRSEDSFPPMEPLINK